MAPNLFAFDRERDCNILEDISRKLGICLKFGYEYCTGKDAHRAAIVIGDVAHLPYGRRYVCVVRNRAEAACSGGEAPTMYDGAM